MTRKEAETLKRGDQVFYCIGGVKLVRMGVTNVHQAHSAGGKRDVECSYIDETGVVHHENFYACEITL